MQMLARSDLFSGDATAVAALVHELRSRVAPQFDRIDGHGWITSLALEDDLYTVTSFWRDEALVAPGSVAAATLDGLGAATGCQLQERSEYEVIYSARSGPTLEGFRVEAVSFECPSADLPAAVDSAREISRRAQVLEGFNFTVVETAPGPRVISVTTWSDERYAAAARHELAAQYAKPPWPATQSAVLRRPGRVIFSSSA
jgi:hypothetical protein